MPLLSVDLLGDIRNSYDMDALPRIALRRFAVLGGLLVALLTPVTRLIKSRMISPPFAHRKSTGFYRCSYTLARLLRDNPLQIPAAKLLYLPIRRNRGFQLHAKRFRHLQAIQVFIPELEQPHLL